MNAFSNAFSLIQGSCVLFGVVGVVGAGVVGDFCWLGFGVLACARANRAREFKASNI